MFTFFWPYPDDSVMTDEAAAAWIGREVPVSAEIAGEKRDLGLGRIVKVMNIQDRKGMLITLERID